MARNNDFRGATLAEAIRKATADYRRGRAAPGSNPFCDRLISRFDAKKVKADHLLDRITDIEREIDGLKDTARAAGLAAALSALAAAGGALATLARVARALRRLRLGKATRQDLLALIPVFGPAASAIISSLDAASALKKAERLKSEVQRLKASYADLTDDLLAIAEQYEDANCHLEPAMV